MEQKADIKPGEACGARDSLEIDSSRYNHGEISTYKSIWSAATYSAVRLQFPWTSLY